MECVLKCPRTTGGADLSVLVDHLGQRWEMAWPRRTALLSEHHAPPVAARRFGSHSLFGPRDHPLFQPMRQASPDAHQAPLPHLPSLVLGAGLLYNVAGCLLARQGMR